MGVKATLIAVVIAAALVSAPHAWAYSELSTASPNPNISASDCASCHAVAAVSVEATGVARQGPHGGYITSGRACAGCHLVHRASAEDTRSALLLPAATITQTCELCHDGTGGSGVYGAIEARGLTVASAHRTDATSTVPGGDASTGGTSTVTFNGLGGTLGCGDCHTPHDSGAVAPFTTDRMRTADDTSGFVSNQLLRAKPSGASTPTTVYGSDWCLGCHKGRSSGLHSVINHSVDASGTPNYFVYDNLAIIEGVLKRQTVMGPLGRSNFGYVMPWPRSDHQSGHAPICQQCHEDVRIVGEVVRGSIVASEAFLVAAPDGTDPAGNPRFQTFPHESGNPSLLLETDEALCLNCHLPAQLR